MKQDSISPSLGDIFPALRIKSVKSLGEGMDRRAFEVNGEYAFLVSKFRKSSEQLEVETALLPLFQEHVGVQIPRYEYIGMQPENSLAIAGYRKIDGVALEKELLMSLDRPLREKLIKDVAWFIAELHSFPVEVAKRCGVQVSDEKRYYSEVLRRVETDLFPKISHDVRRYVMQLLEAYLSDNESFGYTPSLIHVDLSPEHIRYDESNQQLAEQPLCAVGGASYG